MNFADRLSVVRTESPYGGTPRWSIMWSNEGRRKDLYLVHFHNLVPQETAEAVLAHLKQDEHLQRILR